MSRITPENRHRGTDIKGFDWKARRAERLGRCPDEVMEDVRARLAPLLGL
ncbi:MAG: hypothetical protein ACM336_00930 [Acidobacteriota bacterium]